MIIGLAGKKQSGKDTVADYLVAKYGYTKLGFADAVKEMALVLNPLLESNDCDWADYLVDIVNDIGWEEAKKFKAVRKYLQTLGTEACRNILGENVWVDALLTKIDQLDLRDVVIKDVRYVNEWSVCDTTILIERDGIDDGDSHSSEIIDFYPAFSIKNNGTLEELYKEVDRIMEIIKHATK